MIEPDLISYLESINAVASFHAPAAPDVKALAREAYDRLFNAFLMHLNHVLGKYLLETRSTNYNLRHRAHEFKLPLKDDRNYVPRLLFKDMH